ncbi:hypothetical protein AB6Q56_19775 [Dechloromonas sp. ARDL1]|uniref:hypothetical protein n=1 Tax=Dechloromonas sp. ARDL1 TaxID=3322121 RepID=UPI003DA738CF
MNFFHHAASPAERIVLAILVVAGIVACGWALAHIATAILTGVGLMIAVATTGFATAGAVASWMPAATSIGVAAGGASLCVFVVGKVVESGKKQPYEWSLPALTALAVFFVDMTKEIAFSTQLERATFAVVTALLTLVSGFLLMQPKWGVKVIGFLLPFFPVLIVVLVYLQDKQIESLLNDILAAGSMGAIGLVGAIVIALLTGILGLMLSDKSR